jgi:uncharacterized protein (DUF362 family)
MDAARPKVAIARCDARSSDEIVHERLEWAVEQIGGLGGMFVGKKKVFIKANLGIADVRMYEGRQVALTDRAVVRATVALIRKVYGGELVIGDATTDGPCRRVYEMVGHDKSLAPFDVRQAEPNEPPFVKVTVPGGGAMFSAYQYNADLAEADAVVSIAKMKSHVAGGATLCLKNLFGLPPIKVYGRPRRYLHAAVRLPRALVDGGSIFRPCLNVIDGLVSQDNREWHGAPVKTDVLLVGDNTIATDATAMRLMGFDPGADYPDFPFHFDSNAVLLASRAGLGPVAADEIDVCGDADTVLEHRFHVDRQQSAEIDAVRRSVSEQALDYREHESQFLSRSLGKTLALSEGRVLAEVESVNDLPGRARLAEMAGSATAGVYVKRVLPTEDEDENYAVYERVLSEPTRT